MTCPICSKETDPKYRPFCSRRCADVDLGRWLNGSYAVPSTDPDDVDEVIEAMENAQKTKPDRPH
ncbi:DNA gyrase inhibitor YacG [Roseobacter sp. HKCCD9010]|uniref:DNA gyrase inhibitor YacG n=1 Tax=unclassified Roseobacter TaxID=196798 RepID=UPI001491494B|nr:MULTISPECIES: DNA gyrase inhibitor YacG [unclassified Roseobacter]MBF9049782.1 DNA gyrase inhibitor YacG [Rhodobacterales bacterium HKCCD4356]NNV13679.1 DNA gyrase inhibitor YacG [Roseobacter sp. HKCCD7357]NNV16513.1 DNA gyrase inhibitor YacG [Roseobacter sp. HKCCD8768]NNV25972.1 DNA gyrase inhibitor YacG [Roseobacter sp. HKCCD8192]NNV30232.1 DNA gyrase inhibitor YacG [Roseobacter sp. HKCCD9061]